ncbi:MAG TPA: TetR family transcriptional regulator C-terminal domain-containing protein [Solirubrobacteraceae bacterium]|jgi:AcrR family transcriptional regulator|nr:TetR family transcriptional regulator C-terminal domain-containing protein [Solirubrobacteraceae bacterium]
MSPKDVDHDARREELLESVWRVVARDGLEGATIRGMARETGWSVGSLAHYFADKDDILESALRLAYERIAARWDRKLAGLTGLAALRELVLDNLPLDDERELETKFLMNYWSRAIRGGVGVPRPARRGPLLIERLAVLALAGQAAGEIAADRRPADIAELLLGLIDGFSLHALLDPERLTRDRQVALIEEELDRLSRPTTSAGETRGARRQSARRSHA